MGYKSSGDCLNMVSYGSLGVWVISSEIIWRVGDFRCDLGFCLGYRYMCVVFVV